MKWLPILLAAFALTASAADVTGTWKGTAETPAGTIERTFIFKVDVELRYFGGLDVKEVSAVLDVSEETVARDWRLAKVWLKRELERKNAAAC